jgi:cytohesin
MPTKTVMLLFTRHRGADMNKTEHKDGSTALVISIKRPHQKIAEFLISRGADLNKQDKYGRSPLFVAIDDKFYRRESFMFITKLLVDRGADVNIAIVDGASPLFIAVLDDSHMELLNTLIDAGANVNKANKDGMTPIHIAAEVGKEDAVAILLRNGANMYVLTNDSEMPIDIAAECEHRKTVWLLVHTCILDVAIALEAFDLPAYVLLWTINWLPHIDKKEHSEKKKITLIQNIVNSIRRVKNARISSAESNANKRVKQN